jgi:hypothetical protein
MLDDIPVGGGSGSGAPNEFEEGADSGPKQMVSADHDAPIE